MAISNQQIVDWLLANPNADDATIAKTMTAAGVTADQLAKATGSDPKEVAIRFLTQQILAQGTSSQWKGEGHGSAEANARDMAKIMADTGITDISQFGQVTQKLPDHEEWQGDETGFYVTVPGQTVTTYGNKLTGQPVANTYSERQTGNAFGGTFAGSGNTGYRVNFDAQGNPIFYTTAASSNTLANLMQDFGPVGQIALALATGGLSVPQQIAANLAIQALSGKDLGDAIKNAAISLAVAQIPGSDVMKEANKYISGLDLPSSVTGTINNAVQNAVVSGAKAALTGQDIGDAMLKGAAAGGTSGAVTAMLKEIDGFSDLTGAQKKMVINAVTGVISGKPLDQIVINSAIAAANAEIADQKKYAPLPAEDVAELSAGEKAAYDEGGTKALLQFRHDVKTMSGLTTSGLTGDSMGGDYTLDTTDTTGTTGGTDTTDVVSTLQKAGLTDTSADDTVSITGAGGNDTVTGGADALTTGAATTGVTNKGAATTNVGTVTVTGTHECPTGQHWDEDLKQCVLDSTTEDLTKIITGASGNDTITGGTGNDTVVVTGKHECPVGQHWDEDLKMCVLDTTETTTITGGGGNDTITGGGGNDTVVITGKHECPDGQHWDEGLQMCVLNTPATLVCNPGFHEENGVCVADKVENKTITCPTGYKLNDAGTACIPVVEVVDKKCDPGYVYDEDLKQCVPVKQELVCGPGFHEENGVCVPDKQTLTCPPGKVLNAAGTACIDEVVIKDKKCDPGYVYDETLKQCVPETKALVCNPGFHEENGVCVPDKKQIICPTGFKLNDAGTACIPEVVIQDKKCDPGFVYDETLKMCVAQKTTLVCNPGFHEENGVCVKDKLVCGPGFHEENGVCIKDKLTCPPGKVLNADGTACIDEVIIQDKKCDPGYVYDEALKTCVPIKKALVCNPGYHEENGVCVKDKLVCGPGFHEENGICVKDTLVCAAGYEPDATGTKCIPVVVIKDKKCDAGYVYDEALQQCVPITKTLVCAAGFHEENGVCVKDKLVCETGYHEENGVCVKDAVVTPPVVTPPVVTTPKPTTQLPALAAAPTVGAYTDTSTTSPVYAGAMDDFDLFATLQDILSSDANKKSTQQGQQTTKMATGGHLDDLLAEQMTVDDLLKLLR